MPPIRDDLFKLNSRLDRLRKVGRGRISEHAI